MCSFLILFKKDVFAWRKSSSANSLHPMHCTRPQVVEALGIIRIFLSNFFFLLGTRLRGKTARLFVIAIALYWFRLLRLQDNQGCAFPVLFRIAKASRASGSALLVAHFLYKIDKLLMLLHNRDALFQNIFPIGCEFEGQTTSAFHSHQTLWYKFTRLLRLLA